MQWWNHLPNDVASVYERKQCHAVVESPPRMRGTELLAEALRERGGITPADAGNRHHYRRKDVGTTDHPRGCGEQFISMMADAADNGSPPRMRGTATPISFFTRKRRITPADAGNSLPL